MQTVAVIARQVKKHVAELNLFKDETSRSDPFHLRTAIISTRFYIVILIVSVTILIVFTSLGTQSEVITIRNPPLASYEVLLAKNTASLSCTCSRVTIPYANFTWTTVDYHPLCSSVFVSEDWINRLFSISTGSLYQADFRALASSYFQLLAAFCSHANKSVQDALDDFHSETFLTPNVLLPNSLYAEIEIKSQFLQSSTAATVRRLLQLVRTTTQANVLQTAIQLSTLMFLNSFSDVFLVQGHNSFLYQNSTECICVSTYKCSLPVGFFDTDRYTTTQFLFWDSAPLANVSGVSVGCSAIESLLQSTLECLFDWSCLATIHTFIPSSYIISAYALNTNQTRFVPNTSIELIINNLFIENWSTHPSFSNYYAVCAPILCTYTTVHRNNALYVLTKLLGIYGGLTTALRLCVPFVIAWWRKRRAIAPIEIRPADSCAHYLRSIWQSIQVKIIDFNLFKTPMVHTVSFERTTSKISTWIYLFFLCLSMIIIVIFTWLSVQIQSTTVENPSLSTFEDLQSKYTGSLQCPCSQIAIPHGLFISIVPQFHPVCTSMFVSDEWSRAITNAGLYDDKFLANDIFLIGTKFFNSLNALCGLLQTTMSDAWFIFNQSSLITDEVLSSVEFMARAHQTLNQFESDTVAEFKRSLALIRSQTATMYTTGYSDISWRISPWFNGPHTNYFESVATRIDNCSCALSDECKEQVALYNYTWYIQSNPIGVLFYIPNMFTGCFPTQSLLQSSLECLFDRACLDPIVEKINIFADDFFWINASILQTNSTRFPPDMLVQEMINEMMIETWNENINYNQYYEQCAPKLCAYFFPSRNNALYVVTTTIGLFGGLSVALKIIVPLIVGWIRNRIYRRVETNTITGPATLRERVHALWRLIKLKALELNLFESEASWHNNRRRQDEIIDTRIYLFVLTFSVIILIVYTSVMGNTQSFIIKYPPQSRFEQLAFNSRFSHSLDCPCQNISILYNSFISISPHYHQLCSSDFIVHNSLWINLVYYGLDPTDYSYDDYRFFVVPHFRLLFYLCTLANDTLIDALSIFRSNILVSKRAQSRQAVIAQMNAAIDQFLLSTPQTFARTLDFIQQMARGNGLLSPISSNWYMVPFETNGVVIMQPRSYGDSNCSCATNSMCASAATIGEWVVPGFLVGCYPLESLLQSTLECLYDVTCINMLKNTEQSSNMTIRPLNSTHSSSNVTVQSLLNVLMVDRWELSVTYEHYYTICAPLSCTYVVYEQANPIYIATTVIGLYGGLTVALKVLVPVFMKIIRYLIMCRRQRIGPVVAAISDNE